MIKKGDKIEGQEEEGMEGGGEKEKEGEEEEGWKTREERLVLPLKP